MNPEVQKWTSTSDNSEANNSADECQMNPDVQKWTSTSDNFARLALHFHIFFYSMQHMPLWRSKFRMRIKTIRTKKKELWEFRTQVQSFHRTSDPGASITKTNYLRKIGAISDKVWWLEHTGVAQRFQTFCFCLYLYLAKLLSLYFYVFLVIICYASPQFRVFARSASTIFWCKR